MPRDSQVSRVYKWEDVFFPNGKDKPGEPLSLVQCKALVALVWEAYRGPSASPPRLKDGRGTRNAHGSRWDINLPVWARSRVITLHETAHGLLDGLGVAAHGPEFVRLFLDLIWRFGQTGMSMRELSTTARQHGLKIAPAAACPQPKYRVMASRNLDQPCRHNWQPSGPVKTSKVGPGGITVTSQATCTKCDKTLG